MEKNENDDNDADLDADPMRSPGERFLCASSQRRIVVALRCEAGADAAERRGVLAPVGSSQESKGEGVPGAAPRSGRMVYLVGS